MTETGVPDWLKWAREIQSMCRTGLAYSASGYETMRYERPMEIAAGIAGAHTGLAAESLVADFSARPGYAIVKMDAHIAGPSRMTAFD